MNTLKLDAGLIENLNTRTGAQLICAPDVYTRFQNGVALTTQNIIYFGIGPQWRPKNNLFLLVIPATRVIYNWETETIALETGST